MSFVTEPAFLALLFLLGGILIGHVLWYRYQREFDEINHEFKKLLGKQKNFDTTMRNEKSAFARLQSDYSRTQTEWDSLKKSNTSLANALRSLQSETADYDDTVARLERLRQTAEKDLDDERSEREQLEETLRKLKSAMNQLQSNVDDGGNWKAQYDAESRRRQMAEKELDDERLEMSKMQDVVRGMKSSMMSLQADIDDGSGYKVQYDTETRRRQLLEKELDDEREETEKLQDVIRNLKGAMAEITADAEEANNWKSQYETESRKRQTVEDGISELEEKIAALQAEHREAITSMVDAELVDSMQAELVEARRTIAELQTEVGTYEGRVGLLQQDFDGTIASVEQRELELREAKAEIRRQEDKLEELQQTIQQRVESLDRIKFEKESIHDAMEEEQERRQELEREIARMRDSMETAVSTSQRAEGELTQTSGELENSRAEIKRQEAALRELRESMMTQTSTLDRLKFEKEALEEDLAQERDRRSDLEKSIETNAQQARMLFAEKESALSVVGKHERSISDMQAMVDEYREAVDEANEDKKELMDELMEEREARTRLEATLREAQTNVESVQGTAHAAFKEKDSLLGTIKDQSERMASLTTQHDETVASLCSAERTIAELTTRLGGLETSESTLKDERQDLFARLQQERDQRRLLESTLNRNEEMMQQIQNESESLKSLQLEYTGIQTSLQQSMSKMKYLVTERDEALEMADRSRTTIRELRTALEDLQVRAGERDVALARAEEAEQTVAELRATLDELGDVMAERDKAMSAAASADDNIAELQALVAELNARTGEAEAAASRLADLESVVTDLEKVMAERDTALSVLDDANSTIEVLRREIEELRARLEELEKANSSLLERIEAADDEPEIIKFAVENDGPTRYDSQYGLLYNEAPDPIDDLKVISGIAFVYEERLNDLGVYTYEQIMKWNDNNITEFGELLDAAYNDRIRRDDWVGQARKLHNEKYGRGFKRAA